MLKELVEARALPELMRLNSGEMVHTVDDWRIRRRELLSVLAREEYGETPAAPEHVTTEVAERYDSFGGKALVEQLRLTFDTPSGPYTLPVRMIVPKGVERAPVFLKLAFRPSLADQYLPTEELLDNGFAVASLCYADVSSDSAEWDGLAAMYPRDPDSGWGKLGVWAFAASRVMDHLVTRNDIDTARVCISGHSRLGKAALWCAAQDERFAMCAANESGCSGAAISRGKIGEQIGGISDMFGYWFCGNYRRWAGKEDAAPFDQHMLLALIAPRLLYVCSADEDKWSDPDSEFLGCAAASEAWSLHQTAGLITPDAMPTLDEPLLEGNVCYHVRRGTHFFSRTDWRWHMQCRTLHHV